MAVVPLRIGVPQVFISVNDPATNVPSLLTLSGFAVSSITPSPATNFIINDVKTPVSLNTNYQFMLALLCVDNVNKGYTFNAASPGSGVAQVTTAGNGFRLYVPNANWPANYGGAIAVCVFVKKGSASVWTLSELAYLDTSADFEHVVLCDAFPGAPTFTTALLQSSTTDTVAGSRTGIGILY